MTTTQHTEVELLARLARATTLTEQREAAEALTAYRNARSEEIAREGSLDWDAMREVDLRPTFVSEPVTAAAIGSEASGLDWLDEVMPAEHDLDQVATAMRAEATLWFQSLWEPVKHDPVEFPIQARNAARRAGSRFGYQAEQAASIFTDAARHLHRTAGFKVAAWGDEGPKGTDPLGTQPPPYNMPQGSELPNPTNKDTFDGLVNGENGTTEDPKTETSDSPSLKEGEQPEQDKPADGVTPPVKDEDTQYAQDKSQGTSYTDPMPSGGKGASKVADTKSCSVCGKPATKRQSQQSSVHYDYRCDEHASADAEPVPFGGKGASKVASNLEIAKQVAYSGNVDSLADFAWEIRSKIDGISNDEIKTLWEKVQNPGDEKKTSSLFARIRQVFAYTPPEVDGGTDKPDYGPADTSESGDPKTDLSNANPSLKEGEQPEGDKAEPFVKPQEPAQDKSTWGKDPDALSTGGQDGTNAANGPKIEGTPTTSAKTAISEGSKATCHCGRPIEFFEGSWYHLNADGPVDWDSHGPQTYPLTPKEQADKKSSSLKGLGIGIARQASTDNTRIFGQALATMASLDEERAGFTGRDIVGMVLASGDVSPEHRAALQRLAEEGGQTCEVCGDSITKDPSSENPSTWHHDNGEKHDHEAKPKSESKESSFRTHAVEKGECGYCAGTGRVSNGAPGMDLGPGFPAFLPCPRCDGTGKGDSSLKPYTMSSRTAADDNHEPCPNHEGQSFNKSTGDCSCGSNHKRWASENNPGGHTGSRHTAEGPTNSWACQDCGRTVERWRGESDVTCMNCGAEYNASGQRLRDDWRGNPSLYNDDIGDLEGFEMQHAHDAARHTAGDSVEVANMPSCDICAYEEGNHGVPAAYDGKTTFGPWANMCERHFQSHGVGLGTGRGQRLLLKQQSSLGNPEFLFEAAERSTDKAPGRWVVEVLGNGENKWARNSLTFDDKEQATAYAKDLAGRWMGMDVARVRQIPESGLPPSLTETFDPDDSGIVVNYRTASRGGGSPFVREAGWAILTPEGKPLWGKVHESEEEAKKHFDSVKDRTDDLVPKDISTYQVGKVGAAEAPYGYASEEDWLRDHGVNVDSPSYRNRSRGRGNDFSLSDAKNEDGEWIMSPEQIRAEMAYDPYEDDPDGYYTGSRRTAADHQHRYTDWGICALCGARKPGAQTQQSGNVTPGAYERQPEHRRASLPSHLAAGPVTAERGTEEIEGTTFDTDTCATCGAKIVGRNGNWMHDPRSPMPAHPDGSVAGDAHAPRPA